MIRREHRNATAGDVLARLGGGGKPPRRPSSGGTGCGTAIALVLGVVVAVAVVAKILQAVTGDG